MTDRTDPLLLEAELQAVEMMVGEPEERERLATRLSMEGMTLDELLLLVGYARRCARPGMPGDTPGLLWSILEASVKDFLPGRRPKWRKYVTDLRAANRAPEAPSSPEGGAASVNRGPMCAHGRRPLVEWCESCEYVPGLSLTRSGCWNPKTRSFNDGEPDGEDWQRLNGKVSHKQSKQLAKDEAEDRRRGAAVAAAAGTATEAQRREVGPRGWDREPGEDDDEG